MLPAHLLISPPRLRDLSRNFGAFGVFGAFVVQPRPPGSVDCISGTL